MTINNSHPKPTQISIVLLTLYMAQGLPNGFLTQALPTILRQYHVSLAAIGFSGLLLAPWSLKFLWAPLVDKHYSKKHGQSRGWILIMQWCIIALLLLCAQFNPAQLVQQSAMLYFFILLFFISIFSATQDIAVDALAVRLLPPAERVHGNQLQITGYRLGLIMGGGVLLMVLGIIGWRGVFYVMAGLVFLNSLPTLFFKEPDWAHVHPSHVTADKLVGLEQPIPLSLKLRATTALQFYQHLWHGKQMWAWLGVLFVFRISDYLCAPMIKPMMVDMGISITDIGLYGSILGSVGAIVGALLAQYFSRHISHDKALLIFNFIQALGVLFYAVIAWRFAHHNPLPVGYIYAANFFEHAAAAMAMVAIFTVIMEYSRKRFAGSDFTIQVCLLMTFAGFAHVFSGMIAQHTSYTFLFTLSGLLGFILLLPIMVWSKYYSPPQLD